MVHKNKTTTKHDNTQCNVIIWGDSYGCILRHDLKHIASLCSIRGNVFLWAFTYKKQFCENIKATLGDISNKLNFHHKLFSQMDIIHQIS